ncbi:type VI secretion protein [Streptomyces sp. JJ36]|nr:type VI secretion protein [Streptomyces sp. JJ36]
MPDGLLVGVLSFLLGLTALIWTATGLSALLAHGSWPDGLRFTRTPLAIRALATQPDDLAAAWPGTPPPQLSGYGLFWGLFISQLMVLTVLTVFVLGTVTRWRAVRAARRMRAGTTPQAPAAPQPAPDGPARQEPAPAAEPGPAPAAPEALPAQREHRAAPPPPEPTPREHRALLGAEHGAVPRTSTLHYTSRGDTDGAEALVRAVEDAEGALLVVTADPALHAGTAGARAKLGPVHVYDPGQRTDAPSRLRWDPQRGCGDMDTARLRAAALLAPVRSPARTDSAVHDAAETLLRCWLHAAALAGEQFRQVHRWAQSGSSKDAVRVLRTDAAAAAGAAGELEAVLTAYPERREAATEVIRRALRSMTQLHIRNACAAARADRLAQESFVTEGGTLYVVGEPVEDPHRGDPAAMPLVTALTSAVVEHGRRMAAGSSAGRLDPPLTVVLDQPATVAPLPELPALLADGEAAGLLTIAVLRSPEQTRRWWPELTHRTGHLA